MVSENFQLLLEKAAERAWQETFKWELLHQ